jgi:hypothetical protein
MAPLELVRSVLVLACGANSKTLRFRHEIDPKGFVVGRGRSDSEGRSRQTTEVGAEGDRLAVMSPHQA